MIQIRLATPSDAAELQKLNALFNGEGGNTAAGIEESLRSNALEIVCVAADGDILVGFCCGQVVKSMCYLDCTGEITELFVLEAYRRQGVARGLMACMESELNKRGIDHYQLLTGRKNTTAQLFYKSLGYAESSELLFCKGDDEE